MGWSRVALPPDCDGRLRQRPPRYAAVAAAAGLLLVQLLGSASATSLSTAIKTAAASATALSAKVTTRGGCIGDGPYDLVVAVDSSASLRRADFASQLRFVGHFIDLFRVAAEWTRVGVVSYGATYHVNFDLSLYRTRDDVQAAVQRIRQVGRGTSTHRVIEYVREHMLTPAAGARKNARDILLLITDGKSTVPEETRKQAKLTRDRGVEIHVIGVGDRVDDAELHDVAGGAPLSDSRVYFVPSFDLIDRVIEQFKERHGCDPQGLMSRYHTLEELPPSPVPSGTAVTLRCRTEFPRIAWSIGGTAAAAAVINATLVVPNDSGDHLYESVHELVAIDPVTTVECTASTANATGVLSATIDVLTVPARPIISGAPLNPQPAGTPVALVATSFGHDVDTRLLWFDSGGRLVDASYERRASDVLNELTVASPVGSTVYEARATNPRMPGGYASATVLLRGYECDVRLTDADVVLAIDASGGSASDDFRRSLDAAAILIEQFGGDSSGGGGGWPRQRPRPAARQRMAAFVFSDDEQRAWFHLDDHGVSAAASRNAALRALRGNASLAPGGGCLDVAAAVRFSINIMFAVDGDGAAFDGRSSGGGRDAASRGKVLVFITTRRRDSSGSEAFRDAADEARKAAGAGVEIFVISLGEESASEKDGDEEQAAMLLAFTGSRRRLAMTSNADRELLKGRVADMFNQCPSGSQQASRGFPVGVTNRDGAATALHSARLGGASRRLSPTNFSTVTYAPPLRQSVAALSSPSAIAYALRRRATTAAALRRLCRAAVPASAAATTSATAAAASEQDSAVHCSSRQPSQHGSRGASRATQSCCRKRESGGLHRSPEAWGESADVGHFLADHSDDAPTKDWTSWRYVTACSVTCGTGIQRIGRTCKSGASSTALPCNNVAEQHRDVVCYRPPCPGQACGGANGVDLLIVARDDECTTRNGGSVLRLVDVVLGTLPPEGHVRIALTADRCSESAATGSRGYAFRPRRHYTSVSAASDQLSAPHTKPDGSRDEATFLRDGPEDLESLMARARRDNGIVAWPEHAGYRTVDGGRSGDADRRSSSRTALPPSKVALVITAAARPHELRNTSGEAEQLRRAGFRLVALSRFSAAASTARDADGGSGDSETLVAPALAPDSAAVTQPGAALFVALSEGGERDGAAIASVVSEICGRAGDGHGST